MHVLLITLEPKVVEFVRAALVASGHGMTHLERADREAHDGCIAVANRPGGGAIVTCIVGHAPTPAEHRRASRSLDTELRS